MAAPTQQELDVVRRFAAMPEGRLVVRVLQDRLAALDRRNRRAIGEELIRSTGRACELEEILTELFGVDVGPAPVAAPRPQPTRPQKLLRIDHMAVD